MSHHTYTHNIFEESMCVLSTDTSGRYAHVFYVSIPACCYSRIMPDHMACVASQYLRKTNVNLMDDWPAFSADLNPINLMRKLIDRFDCPVKMM